MYGSSSSTYVPTHGMSMGAAGGGRGSYIPSHAVGVDLTTRLFAQVGLARNQKAPSNLKEDFTYQVGTLERLVKMTDAEKKLKTGLFEMVTSLSSSVTGQATLAPPRVWMFPTNELENELKLQIPREVQPYDPKASGAASSAPAGQKSQKSKENVKKMRAANTTAAKAKRNSAVMDAGHYVSEDAVTIGNTTLSGYDLAEAVARKRMRGDEDGYDYDGEGEGESGGGGGSSNGEDVGQRAEPLPTNFYELIREVLDYFWFMEFEDESAAKIALFAKIDSSNCAEFGLESYASSASSLAVIRDRMDATLLAKQQAEAAELYGSSSRVGAGSTRGVRPYTSLNDFSSDFRQMFSDIERFWPASSPVRAKAKELSDEYTNKWQQAQAKFKFRKS